MSGAKPGLVFAALISPHPVNNSVNRSAPAKSSRLMHTAFVPILKTSSRIAKCRTLVQASGNSIVVGVDDLIREDAIRPFPVQRRG